MWVIVLVKDSIHPKRYDVFIFYLFITFLVKIQICSFIVNNTDNLKQFLFTINNIDEYSENSFEWLVPEKRLFWAIDIEDIGGYHRQVFDFATKYFRENLSDYLWLDSLKWAYSAKEIETLSQLPYSPKWLYEKLV